MNWARRLLDRVLAHRRRMEQAVSVLDHRLELLEQNQSRLLTALTDPSGGLEFLAARLDEIGQITRNSVAMSEQVFALGSRLDADVVAGFAAVVQRLEGDLTFLAGQVHQLGSHATELSSSTSRSLAALVESNRHTAATLARLATDHVDQKERLSDTKQTASPTLSRGDNGGLTSGT